MEAACLAPRARVVICGSRPNLVCEHKGSLPLAGFSDPDLFDHFPIQVIAFSHCFSCDCRCDDHAAAISAGFAGNLLPSSTWPRLPAPSCWPGRLRPAFSISRQHPVQPRSRSDGLPLCLIPSSRRQYHSLRAAIQAIRFFGLSTLDLPDTFVPGDDLNWCRRLSDCRQDGSFDDDASSRKSSRKNDPEGGRPNTVLASFAVQRVCQDT